ncbi:hypothetical protein LXL04_017356 [Taraxacum kok-saghyz]
MISKIMEAFLEQIPHLKTFKLEQMNSITENFDNNKVIGEGGFGKVYAGVLSDSEGQIAVALKRMSKNSGQGNPEFLKEILMLSHYTHNNLINLVGFCDEDDEKILVYQHAYHGSLDTHLSSMTLTWTQRLKICIGAARGLAYLHDPQGTQQRVIHRDIKSSNILIDENWIAKISDMGLSKIGPANQSQSFLATNAAGTPLYIDPMYVQTGILTKESDVYSFGVILFEVLCGSLCCKIKNGQYQSLVNWWKKSYEKNNLDKIIFHALKQGMDMRSREIFSEIAYQCLEISRAQRPKMSQVVEKLEFALQFQLGISNPEEFKELVKSVVDEEELELLLSKGIIFNDGNTWFTLNEDGEHCEMISGECFIPISIQDPDHGYAPFNGKPRSRVSILTRNMWGIFPDRLTEFETQSLRFGNQSPLGGEPGAGYGAGQVSLRSHLFQFAADQFSDAGALLSVQHIFEVRNRKDLYVKFNTHVRTRFLSPDIIYQVNLVFMNVRKRADHLGIQYKLPSETNYSMLFLAHEREDGWLTTELYQFINDTSNVDLEIEFDCAHGIEVEGIEFVPVEKVSRNKRFHYVFVLLVSQTFLKDEDENEDDDDDDDDDEDVDEDDESDGDSNSDGDGDGDDDNDDEDDDDDNEEEEEEEEEDEDTYWEKKLPSDYKRIILWGEESLQQATKKELYSIFCKGFQFYFTGEQWISLEKNGKKCHMLSARKALGGVTCPCVWQSLPESRFGEVAIDPFGDLWILCSSDYLSPKTTYATNLVYKLQENHSWFEHPVVCKRILYPEPDPCPWVICLLSPQAPDIIGKFYRKKSLPQERNDGWMEVQLYEFQTDSRRISIEFMLNLYNFKSLQGLIIQGIEFKPI